MKKALLSLAVACSMAAGLTACSGSGKAEAPANATENNQPAGSTDSGGGSAEGKQDLVIMITNPGDVNNAVEQKVIEKFGDKYNIITKAWDNATVEQTVKTAAAANEQFDLVQYWPNQMNSFTSADLAMDLTPYMDEEWRATFNEGVLESGTYDGKLYNIAYKTVYPLMMVDLEVTRAAGIDDSEIKDQMSWDEFIGFCQRINDNTDYYGAGVMDSFACWLVRNGVMQAWDTDAELDAWNEGKVSFHDEKIVAVFDRIADAFNKKLFYPGDGALAVTQDQIYGAMSAHKIGFNMVTNSNVSTVLDNVEGLEFKIVDWPKMGANPTNPILGGSDGYFIPSCAKNVEGAVEVMKYLTSEEIMTFRAEGGQVPCAKISEDADLDAAFMASISRCASQIYPTEIVNVDAELSQYIMYQMPANYIYNGSSALNELEDLRIKAVGQ